MARGYFENIVYHLKSTSVGMGVTLKHFFHTGKGKNKHSIYTYQYPDEGHARAHEEVSERHRGVHFLEPSKCILCLLCAKVCPVQCIVIEGVRLGKEELITRFTIDYSKCLFCALCTEPCPTDCIHHGREWDYSGYERGTLVKDMLKGEVYTLESHEASKVLLEEAKIIEKAFKAEQAEIKKLAAEAKKKAGGAKKAVPKAAPKAEKPAKALKKPEAKAKESATKQPETEPAELKADPEEDAETQRKPTRAGASETVQLPKPPGHDAKIDRARADLKRQADKEAKKVVVSEIAPKTVKGPSLEPEVETLKPETAERTDRSPEPASLDPEDAKQAPQSPEPASLDPEDAKKAPQSLEPVQSLEPEKKAEPPALAPEGGADEGTQTLEPEGENSQKSSDSQALDPAPEDPEADLMK